MIVARTIFIISALSAALLATATWRDRRTTSPDAIMSREFASAKRTSKEIVVASKFCYAIFLSSTLYFILRRVKYV